jgi:enamine deaminase RidA (YjgF/YER057c/UK114 family)
MLAGGFFFTAGLGPHDPSTRAVVGKTIEEQTIQVMRNFEGLLGERGLDLTYAVKMTVHLQHLLRDSSGFNKIYQEFVSAPYPVRTTVGSDLANILVEVDAIAVAT